MTMMTRALLLLALAAPCFALGVCGPKLSLQSSRYILSSSSAKRATLAALQLRPLYSGKGGEDLSAAVDYPKVYLPIGIVGTAANFICFYSLYLVQTTGSGVEGDLPGLVEGLSYLAVAGVFVWSAFTKVTTGDGLPGNPFVLGLAEGLSYLTVLGALVIGFMKLAV